MALNVAPFGRWTRQSNYAPPGVQLLWRLGCDCPPPHLARFWSVFLVCALYSGVTMGAFMLAVSTFAEVYDRSLVPMGAAVTGLGFGTLMATYYAMGRRKYRLPLWKDLSATAET